MTLFFLTSPLKPKCLEHTIVNFSDEAVEATRHRIFETWEALETFSQSKFGMAQSVSYLQYQLHKLKQYKGENVKDFALRVEKAYY